jgi:hypothetical protein
MDPSFSGPIKIGRINSKVERALGLSLVSDVAVYLEEKDLDHLATIRPNDYLKTIDEITGILKSPDYVRYEEKADSILYLKEYIKGGLFTKVAVEIVHEGTPKVWRFNKLFCLGEELTKTLNAAKPFVRPIES